MRSRGWAGITPASDEEAIGRILDAADEVIARCGSAMTVAEVARTLGVTRQTVYRYFPGADALLVASATRAANDFIGRLTVNVRKHSDPVTAIVESVAFAAEHIRGDRRLTDLLTRRQHDGANTSLTSNTAIAFCRSALDRFDIDWPLHGFEDSELDEVAELMWRTVQSLVRDPGHPVRDSITLRGFIARWIGPAILYPRLRKLEAELG